MLPYRFVLRFKMIEATQAAGLVYHHDAVVDIIKDGNAALASHHAGACISLRLDDIQHFVLMIYRNKLRMIYKAYALIYL